MKRILVKSVYDAFDYVMDHYYPAGQRKFAPRSDTYAVISIQDTHTQGFGVRFQENEFCRGVLTLYFDDVERPVEGAVLFTEDQAREVIDFVMSMGKAETLLVHCYGGESRSRAVGAFAAKMLGADNSRLMKTGHPNRHVLATLEKVWSERV